MLRFQNNFLRNTSWRQATHLNSYKKKNKNLKTAVWYLQISVPFSSFSCPDLHDTWCINTCQGCPGSLCSKQQRFSLISTGAKSNTGVCVSQQFSGYQNWRKPRQCIHTTLRRKNAILRALVQEQKNNTLLHKDIAECLKGRQVRHKHRQSTNWCKRDFQISTNLPLLKLYNRGLTCKQSR